MKVPAKQRPRKRLWLNDGSCIRLRPEWKNHVWAYYFMHCCAANGKSFHVLVVIDEYSRECLALHVARTIRAEQVMHILADLFLTHGRPDNIRSDYGPEGSGKALDASVFEHGVQIEFTRLGKPTDNGRIESFNGKFRGECLNQNVFLSLHDARRTVEAGGVH